MAEREYISLDTAYDIDTLGDWYINSVSQDDTPVWTQEHLEELFNDFYVIPKDTPTADVAPVKHGKWEICSDGYYPYCKSCHNEPKNGVMTPYCPNCGAKMDEDGEKNEDKAHY